VCLEKHKGYAPGVAIGNGGGSPFADLPGILFCQNGKAAAGPEPAVSPFHDPGSHPAEAGARWRHEKFSISPQKKLFRA
jgi:hypothetical protein